MSKQSPLRYMFYFYDSQNTDVLCILHTSHTILGKLMLFYQFVVVLVYMKMKKNK